MEGKKTHDLTRVALQDFLSAVSRYSGASKSFLTKQILPRALLLPVSRLPICPWACFGPCFDPKLLFFCHPSVAVTSVCSAWRWRWSNSCALASPSSPTSSFSSLLFPRAHEAAAKQGLYMLPQISPPSWSEAETGTENLEEEDAVERMRRLKKDRV